MSMTMTRTEMCILVLFLATFVLCEFYNQLYIYPNRFDLRYR
jgi:hypothetical protein